MAPEPDDPLARMSGEIYQEYRTLRASGIMVDAGRFLAFREQTQNFKHTQLFIEDAGIIYIHKASRIRFKFVPEMLFYYLSGLPTDEDKELKDYLSPLYTASCGLTFWKRNEREIVLAKDKVGGQNYLPPDRWQDFAQIERLQEEDKLVLRPMGAPKALKEGSKIIDLDL